jgi:hypothetical protein
MYNAKTPCLPTLVAKEARIISKLQQVVGLSGEEVSGFRLDRWDIKLLIIDRQPR